MSRVIPCLDVRDGRVVKGIRFSDLRDAGSPADLARQYEDQGADEIVLLDVSATADGRSAQVQTIRAVREMLSIPLTVGGGVRSAEDAHALLLAGADKVSVNTAAAERPALLAEMAERFGRQCTVLALDAARRAEDRWEVVTHSGRQRTGLDAVEWAQAAARLGAGEILLTSFDRDGTRTGYDLPLIRAITGSVGVPIIASGGAATIRHMAEALHCGADAVLAASIFHDSEMTVAEAKQGLRALDVEVRL